MPDEQAWVLAGAIAFSDSNIRFQDGSVQQEMQYPVNSYWSPDSPTSPELMAQKLMEFSMGAVAALDFGGARVNATGQLTPGPAQIVHVQWEWATLVLGIVPLTQAVILLIVIGFANKAVIRDESPLACARLLRPVVEKLGPRGCLLTGDEIAEELGNYRIVYGPRMPRGTQRGQEDGVIKHIDVIPEEEDIERWHGRMPAGRYDGTSTWEEEDVGASEETELLIRDETELRVGRRKPVARRMSF
jgi:hypothetical protein